MGQRRAIGLGVIGLVLLVCLGTVACSGSGGTTDGVTTTGETIQGKGFTTYRDPDGQFSLSVAPGWVPVALRGDRTGLGARTAPEDAVLGVAIDDAVSGLPADAALLVLDGRGIEEHKRLTTLRVQPVPREGATIADVESGAAAAAEALGGLDVNVTRVATSIGDGVRVSFSKTRKNAVLGIGGVHYYVLANDVVWALTFRSEDIAANEQRFATMARSFLPFS